MRPIHLTLLIDNREKRALPFRDRYLVLDRSSLPVEQKTRIAHLKPAPKRLPDADYCLADEQGVCYTLEDGRTCGVVETKRSASEIADNCLTPMGRRRFVDLLGRLRSRYARPLLLLEGTFAHFLSPTRDRPNPGLALDALFDLAGEFGVPVQLYGGETLAGRWLAGEYVARFLISGVLSHARDHEAVHFGQPPGARGSAV